MNWPITNWTVAGAVIPSLLIAWLAGFAARRRAPRWGLVDVPGGRKIHRAPTPLGGGLAIALGVALPLAAGSLALWWWHSDGRPYLSPTLYEWLGNSFFTQAVVFLEPHLPGLFLKLPDLWLLLAAAGLLLLLGLRDDLGGLDWRVRLAIQVLVAAAVVYGRGWRITCFVDWSLLTGGADGVVGCRPGQFVQYARQYGRIIGRRGCDRGGIACSLVAPRAANGSGWLPVIWPAVVCGRFVVHAGGGTAGLLMA